MNKTIIAIVLGCCVNNALAAVLETLPAFEDVDRDLNGLLSISEAQAAFPGLEIQDKDGDNYLNKDEAEEALPGFYFTPDTHEDDENMIRAPEYRLMAQYFLTSEAEEER